MISPLAMIRFEDFELSRATYELRRGGRAIHLERIPLELLLLLVERRGQLVTRQEILAQVWGKGVVIDADNAINTAIRKIRQALRDDPENPRLLFTVPARGYRFLAPDTAAQPATPLDTSSAAIQAQPPLAPASTSAQRSYPRTWWLAGAVALGCAVVVASLLAGRLWKAGEARAAPAMLMVLPFVNLTGDAQQEYFADGMTEELIARLGSIDPAHLGVIARTTAMRYKGAGKNISEIARDLGVSYVLEGSVRRDAQRVRITGQLIRGDNQTHVWAENYDGDAGDVLNLQSKVAQDIAIAIRPLLASVLDRRPAAHSLVPEAHDAYLRGLQAWNLRTRAGSERSIAEFTRALRLDPSYAQAFAALARTYSLAPVFGGAGASDAMPRARAAALQAVKLDDSLAEAHATLAFVAAHYDYDWGEAAREFQRALALNPSDANTHLFYSNSYLSPLGRHEEAIAEMRTAIRLDPLSLPIQAFLGRTLVWARRYDQALTQLKQVEQLNPNFPIVQERLAHLYTYRGEFSAAISAETKARLLTGEDPKVVMATEEALRSALAQHGPAGYWHALLRLSQSPENPPEAYDTSYGLAIILARIGERDRAIEQLQRAYEERQLALTEIAIEPAFDELRADQRFAELLRRIGLSR